MPPRPLDPHADVTNQRNSVPTRLNPAARLWGRKMLRYSLVSLISIAVSQSVLMVAFGMLHWTASLANVVACAVATVPSYYLNRSWA
jgi:putative flippase GtrA